MTPYCTQLCPMYTFYTEEMSTVLLHTTDKYINKSFYIQLLYPLMKDKYDPKHARVSGFCNIIVNLTQLCAGPSERAV